MIIISPIIICPISGNYAVIAICTISRRKALIMYRIYFPLPDFWLHLLVIALHLYCMSCFTNRQCTWLYRFCHLPGGWHVTQNLQLNPQPLRYKTTAFHTERQPLISYDQSSETNDELTASVPILETENSFWIQRNKHFHWEANTNNKMQLEKNRLWTEEVQINEGRRKKTSWRLS